MKLNLLVIAFFCLVAAASAKRLLPIPNETCPQRYNHYVVAYPDDFESQLGYDFYNDYLEEAFEYGLFYGDYLKYDEYGAPESECRDAYPFYDYYSIDYEDATDVREFLSEWAERSGRDFDGNLTLIMVRENITAAPEYADAALSAQANGLRIVTIDIGFSKAQSMATLTASEPRDKNALAFPNVIDTFPSVPLVFQTIRGDIGRKCVISDHMTVHTFDGKALKHNGIGDYVLFRKYSFWENDYYYMQSFEVQVRTEPCYNLLRQRQACISSVGFRLATDYDEVHTGVISYDRELNDITLTFDGVVFPSDFPYLQDYLFVHRIEPDVGIHVDVPFWPNYRMVSIDFFKDETRDPVIIITGPADGFAMSTGMCGTFDSCAENEFVTADGKNVYSANESVPTWNVHGGESIFEWQQYLDVLDPEAAMSLRPPLVPASWTTDIETLEDGGLSELNDDVLFAVCDEYCRFHSSGLAVIDNAAKDENPCIMYCDEQAEDLVGLANFDIFAEYNDTNLPAVAAGMHTDGKSVKFHAPMGGSYVFAVRAADCCGEGADANVTVNVRCAKSLAIEIENDADTVLELLPFPVPELRLKAKLSGEGTEDVHVEWRVTKAPRAYDEAEFSPVLRYPHSLTATLLPDYVGNYTVEVFAFDGCNRVNASINVSVSCLDMPKFMQYFSQGSIRWTGSQFSYAYVNYDLPCVMAPYIRTMNTDIFADYEPDIHSDVQITAKTTADPMLTIQRSSIGGSYDYHYLGWYAETPVTSNTTVTRTDITPIVPSGCGSIPSKNGINRIEGQNCIESTVIEAYEETTEQFTGYKFLDITECGLEMYRRERNPDYLYNRGYSWVITVPLSYELPEWANTTDIRRVADLNAPFNFGACAAVYHANVSIGSDTICNNRTYEHDWHVTCDDGWVGPYSKPIWPCFPTVYDYDAQEFPQVLLNGLDSGDRKSRTLQYRWVTKSLPEGATDPITGRYQSSTTLDVSPNVEGEYTFELAVSNGCRVDREETTVAAECAGEVNAVATCPPATIVFNYTDTDENGFELVGTLSSTTATLASGDIAPLTFRWDGAGPLGSATWNTENVTVPGAGIIGGVYSANLTVTDGCRTDTASCMLTVTCPNVLTAHASVNLTTAALNPITGDSEPIAAFDLSTSNEAHFVEWVLYYDVLGNGSYTQDVWGSANNNFNITFTVDVAGDYKLVLTATDRCMVSTDEVFFSATCGTSNVMSPYIQMTNAGGSVVYVENATVFTADSAASSAGEWEGATVPFTRAWRLVWPDGTVETGTAVQFSSSTGLIPGEYNLTLTITDQCKSASRDMNLHVLCARQVNPVAHASAATVTWMGNKFPIVSLDGDSSVVHEMERSSATYLWTILDAPEASVFKGRDNVRVETTVTNLTQESDFVDWHVEPYAGSTWERINFTKTTQKLRYVTIKTVEWTELTPDVTATPVLGACFRPDVPGRYTLEFALSSACDSEIATVSVDAVCNGAPVLAATIPSESLVWETIMLDASATADPNGDTLSYTWTVGLCNETYDYTYNMLNSLSATPLFTPTNPGNYCVTLEVSDGCSTVNGMWTIDVGCNTTVSETIAPLAHEYTVDFAGTGLQVVALEVEESETVGERSQQWLNTHGYAWTLIAYSPAEVAPAGGLSGGAIAGIVIGVLAGLALLGVGAAFLIMWLLKRKAAGGASTSSGSSTATEGAEVEMPPATV